MTSIICDIYKFWRLYVVTSMSYDAYKLWYCYCKSGVTFLKLLSHDQNLWLNFFWKKAIDYFFHTISLIVDLHFKPLWTTCISNSKVAPFQMKVPIFSNWMTCHIHWHICRTSSPIFWKRNLFSFILLVYVTNY